MVHVFIREATYELLDQLRKRSFNPNKEDLTGPQVTLIAAN